jgi:GH15 family glucan-1,4-alpha-glucosidase
MLAAATTSLPESPGGERNWDYRYSWIRDSTFMLWGLYSLGFDWEANDFFYFIADVAEAEEARPPDHVRDRRRGEMVPRRRSTTCRDTRARARPDRERRYDQDQHDVGARCWTRLPAHEVARPRYTSASWPILKQPGRSAIENWRDPDRGLLGGAAASRSTSPRRS